MTDPIQATPLSVPQADALRRGLPLDAPAIMRREAMFVALQFFATEVVSLHGLSASRLAERNPEILLPTSCPCRLCRQVRPFLESSPHADA